MNTKTRYAAIRFNDRPIARPITDPETFSMNPDAAPGTHESKPAHRLSDLYPDIAKYRTVSTDLCLSPQVMQKEWDTLWTRTWQMAGREKDIPNVGDWFRYDVGRESFIVVREKTGSVRALYNVCKHRGNRLVREDFGHAVESFTCGFHSWCYDLRGRNVRITDPKTFAPEALRGNLNLTEAHVRTWGGFVFICMAESPPPFEEYFGELFNFLEPYRIEEMFVVKDVQLDVRANWKTAMDAFQEAYHVHAAHPQAKILADDYFVQYDFYPNGHNRQLLAVGSVSPRWPDQQTVNPALAFLLQEAGIDVGSYKGTAADVRKSIQQAKRKPDNCFGLGYSRFSDNQLTDDWNVTLFPNMTFNAHPEGVLVQRFRPHATDPQRSIYDILILVPKLAPGIRPPAYMGLEPDIDISGTSRPSRRYTTMDDPQMGELLEQDADNIPFVQLGLNSRALAGVVRYGEQERRIQQFYAELDRYLTGSK